MTWPTADDLANWTGQTIPSARATLLIDMAKAACGSVAKSIGAQLDETAADELELDGTGADTLMLPGWPVTAVTSVEVEGTALEADDYEWSRVGELTRATVFGSGGWPGASPRTFGAWPAGKRNVVVVYTHGLATIPNDIKLAALLAAARWAANPQSLTQFSGDNIGMGFAGAILNAGEAELVIRGLS